MVNTCGFLDIAREESVDTILQAAELKNTGSLKELVVMGCLSERYPDEIKKEIPEIDRIFGTNDHKQVVSFITGKEYVKDDPLFYRSLMTPRHYAYLKIAEGCDNGCSFCSIPIMRGLQHTYIIKHIMRVIYDFFHSCFRSGWRKKLYKTNGFFFTLFRKSLVVWPWQIDNNQTIYTRFFTFV